MPLARIALVLTAALLLAGAPNAGAAVIDQFPFSIDAGGADGTQAGRLQTGAASTCTLPKSVPGTDPGTFNDTGVVEQSLINEPACITTTYSTADASCQANGLFSAAYLANFDASAIQDFYAGDVGAAPGNASPVSYSVSVPGNEFLIVIFNMRTAGTGCASFDVTISSDRPWAYFKPPIRGHPYVGQTLTSIDNLWNGSPTFTHQWRRCAADGTACADIPGATGTTYMPTPDDVGHTLRTHITATDSGMSSTADSDPVLIGVQFDAAPSGQSLSASDATQNGRLNRLIRASSCNGSPTTAPALFDAAHTRFYDVFRHTNASDSTLCTMVSVDYNTTCTSNRPFSVAYLPSFDPTSLRTNYLADSGSSGTFGERTIRYSFGVPPGAAYDVVLTTANAGVTCPDYDMRFGTASPYPTGAPSVDGTPQAGQTLTAGDGTWTGAPTSFAYQWQRCFGDGSGCGDIPGATAKTLALTNRNVGDTFRVRVTATEGLGSASKSSATSAAVAEAPPAPPPPGPPDYAGISLKGLTKVIGRSGRFTLSLTCPAAAIVGCAGADSIKLGKATLGTGQFAVAPGKVAKMSFTLSKAVRKRLAKRRTLKATQVVNSSDVRGVPVRTSARLTLKAKPRG